MELTLVESQKRLSSEDFSQCGLPQFTVQDSQAGGDYFTSTPLVDYALTVYVSHHENMFRELTVTALCSAGSPISNSVFIAGSQRKWARTLGVTRKYCESVDDIVYESVTPVVPKKLQRVSQFGAYSQGMYIEYFPGFNYSESPETLYDQLRTLLGHLQV